MARHGYHNIGQEGAQWQGVNIVVRNRQNVAQSFGAADNAYPYDALIGPQKILHDGMAGFMIGHLPALVFLHLFDGIFEAHRLLLEGQLDILL